MSFLKKLKKKEQAPSLAETQEQNQETIKSLSLKIQVLEKRKNDMQKNAALAVKSGNKQKAINYIKQKKLIETQITRLNGMQYNLTQQDFAITNANLNKVVIDAMKANKEALKKELGGMTVEDIDQVRDEMEEIMDLNQEISEALSRPIGQQIDEGELEDEYEALLNGETKETEDEAKETKKYESKDEEDLNRMMAAYA